MAAGRLYDPDLRRRLYGTFEDVLGAASIDGASGWVKMKNIILPLMMSSVTICLFLTSVPCVHGMRCNLSLTGGAPYRNHRDGSHAYMRKHSHQRQFGVGQAEAFILFYHCSLHQRYSGIHHQKGRLKHNESEENWRNKRKVTDAAAYSL